MRHLLLSLFLSLAPTLIQANSYLEDLEELGYCVIPGLFSADETERLYERVWHEYIERAWPLCRMDDRSNWKEAFPMHNLYGIFSGPAGQTQVMWDLRQDARIIDLFARIWNTNELAVSMDGLSIMCPPEIREGFFEIWPHVDQGVSRRQDDVRHDNNAPTDFVSESSLKTGPFTIQGQFLFEDSFEDDGGFYCIPKSHLRFDAFAPELEAINARENSPAERRKARAAYIKRFFEQKIEDSSEPYQMKHITAPRGSLILWDSRTLHWNQHPRKDRPYSDNPKVRMVGYLSYVPKARLTDENWALMREAFEEGISTGHNPGCTDLKRSKDYMHPEFAKYLEDPSYVQPQINLTPVGEALINP